MKHLAKSIFIAGVLALVSTATALAQGTFQFKAINHNDSVETEATGINRARTIVGTFANAADDANEIEHGFLRYRSGATSRPLNTPHSIDTSPIAINNRGDLTGESAFYLPPGITINRCFIREGTHYEVFDVPIGGGSFPDCNGINNHGDVVGSNEDSVTPGNNHGFLRTEDGTFTQLDFPGATNTEATGINDERDVVGFYTDTNGFDHGFIWDDGNFTTFDFPGGQDTNAFGINNRHEIVGSYTSSLDGTDHGFMLKTDGTYLSIDVTLPNQTTNAARGINDDSWIVGTYTDANGQDQGFLTREP